VHANIDEAVIRNIRTASTPPPPPPPPPPTTTTTTTTTITIENNIGSYFFLANFRSE
jgi:hypothetical protein